MLRFSDYFELIEEKQLAPVQVLEKYKDDPDVCISFTAILEPRAKKEGADRDRHGNPIDKSADKKTERIGVNPLSHYDTPIGIYCYPLMVYWHVIKEYSSIPYVKEKPIVWVFKPRHPNKCYKTSTYTTKDLERDMETLQDIFPKYNIQEIRNDIDSYYKKNPLQEFWSVTRDLANYRMERTQVAVEPTYKGAEVKDITTKAPTMWTKILKLFCDGVIDDTGSATIHGNEPTQAVFWTSAQIQVLDKIDRKKLTSAYDSKEAWKGELSENKNQKMISYFISKLKKNKDFKIPENIKDNQNYKLIYDTIYYAVNGMSSFTTYLEDMKYLDGVTVELYQELYSLYYDNPYHEKEQVMNNDMLSLMDMEFKSKYSKEIYETYDRNDPIGLFQFMASYIPYDEYKSEYENILKEISGYSQNTLSRIINSIRNLLSNNVNIITLDDTLFKLGYGILDENMGSNNPPYNIGSLYDSLIAVFAGNASKSGESILNYPSLLDFYASSSVSTTSDPSESLDRLFDFDILDQESLEYLTNNLKSTKGNIPKHLLRYYNEVFFKNVGKDIINPDVFNETFKIGDYVYTSNQPTKLAVVVGDKDYYGDYTVFIDDYGTYKVYPDYIFKANPSPEELEAFEKTNGERVRLYIDKNSNIKNTNNTKDATEVNVGDVLVWIETDFDNMTFGKEYTVVALGTKDYSNPSNTIVSVIADDGKENGFYFRRFKKKQSQEDVIKATKNVASINVPNFKYGDLVEDTYGELYTVNSVSGSDVKVFHNTKGFFKDFDASDLVHHDPNSPIKSKEELELKDKKIEIGDTVRCVNDQKTPNKGFIKYGELYTVSDITSGYYLSVTNKNGETSTGWATTRFVLVKKGNNPQKPVDKPTPAVIEANSIKVGDKFQSNSKSSVVTITGISDKEYEYEIVYDDGSKSPYNALDKDIFVKSINKSYTKLNSNEDTEEDNEFKVGDDVITPYPDAKGNRLTGQIISIDGKIAEVELSDNDTQYIHLKFLIKDIKI